VSFWASEPHKSPLTIWPIVPRITCKSSSQKPPGQQPSSTSDCCSSFSSSLNGSTRW
jgi:hypothetical protein